MGIPLIQSYELPSQIAMARPALPWRVDTSKAALLIHDMQNYFLARYESASFVETLVQRIAAIRRHCHALNIPVFYSAQRGNQSPAERGLLLDFWGSGMPGESDATAIVQGLEPREGDQLIVKHRYSAFARNDFHERLQQQGRSQLIICGVYAHIGCLVTAADAFMADIEPFLVADALADFSLDHHHMALQHVAHCSGKVLSTAELLQQMEDSE